MAGISRRTLLSTVALGLTTAAGCGAGSYRGLERTLTIASGPLRGFFWEFGELLAAQIRSVEPRLRATAISTEGSLENLQLLHDGQVDLALALADTAQATATIGGPPPAPVPMRAIGRIYQNYLHLVVLAASPIHTLADLAGRTVSSAAHGSATRLTGRRLLEVAGLASSVIRVYDGSSPDGINALEAGRIDALLWSAGLPTPLLAELSARRDIRLLPLDSVLPAMRLVYGPVYRLATVPANAYGAAPELPTIGVANLLLCRPEADPAVTAAVARVLVTRAARLVPAHALGIQFLDPRSLIATAGIPLHPGAITAYRALRG